MILKIERRVTSHTVYGDLGPDRTVTRTTRYEIYDGTDYHSLVLLCKRALPLIAQRLAQISEKIQQAQEQFTVDLASAQLKFEREIHEYKALGFWKRLITSSPVTPNEEFVNPHAYELKTMREFSDLADAIFGKLEKFADFPGMFFHEECNNTIKIMIEWVHNEKI